METKFHSNDSDTNESVANSDYLDPVSVVVTERRFDEYIDQIFEESTKNKYPPITDFFEIQRTVIAMAPLTREDEELLQNGRITPLFRAIAKLFFEALLRKVSKERKNETVAEQKKLQVFLNYIHEIFFCYSPNLTQYLGTINELHLGAKATRIPEAQGWFGATMVGELVYNLQFADDSVVQQIVMELQNSSMPDVLDFIHYLQTVAANANANGSWANGAINRIQKILTEIERNHTAVLVQYATKLALKRIEQEEENPSVSIFKRHGDRKEGRLIEGMDKEMEQESRRLMQQVKINNHHNGQLPLQVARDAMALFDHSTLPRSFAFVNTEALPQPKELDINKIRTIQTIVRNRGASLDSLLDSHAILSRAGIIQSPSDWNKLIPEISKEDWETFFTYGHEIRDANHKMGKENARLEKEAGDACETISKKFLEDFSKSIPNLDSSMSKANLLPQEYIDKFKASYAQGNDEQALYSAEEILQFFEIREKIKKDVFNENSIDTIGKLRKSHSELIGSQVRVWEEAKQHMQLFLEKNRSESSRKKMQMMPTFIKIQEHEETVGQNLLNALNSLKENAETHLTPVTFHPYEDIQHQYQLNPFSQAITEDIPLLLQHLHKPGMRRMIEQDLGIDFKTIPLSSQIHLLRFLSESSADTFEKLRNILQKNPKSATDVLLSFLACAQDISLGDTILNLAGNTAFLPAIHAYAVHTQYAQQHARYIAEMYKEACPNSPKTQEYFYGQLLAQANSKLKDLTKKREQGKDTQTIIAEFCRLLSMENYRIARMRDLVASLPRTEVATLDLMKLSTAEIVGPKTGAELQKAKYFGEIQSIIAQQFTGDEQEFNEQFLSDPTSELYYSRCENKLLGFFGVTKMRNGTKYLDWYSTNPDAVVPGLAEATLITGVKNMESPNGIYAVAAPHVASSTTLIEKLGCVGFAKTSEYNKTYMRLRNVPAEKNRYASRTMSEEDENNIRSICDATPNKLIDIKIAGKTWKALRTEFHDKTHMDEINAESSDGQIYNAIAELCPHNQWVMTRYIPHAENTRSKQIHYCVFEQSCLPQRDYDTLNGSIRSLHQDHNIGSLK